MKAVELFRSKKVSASLLITSLALLAGCTTSTVTSAGYPSIEPAFIIVDTNRPKAELRTQPSGQLAGLGVPPSGGLGTNRSKVIIAATNQIPRSQSVTGSRIPLNPDKQAHTYKESPLTVRAYEETEFQKSGYPDVATFLQRRGSLR